MKKKMLFLILIASVFGFIPIRVYAKNVESIYNTNIDYQFFIEEDNARGLKFKLYNKTGSLSYDSEYDANKGNYYFFVDENNYTENFNEIESGYFYNALEPIGYWNESSENGIRDYIPYSNQLQKLDTFNDVKDFFEINKLNNSWKNYGSYYRSNPINEYGKDYNGYGPGLGRYYEFNIYTYIPMILEAFDDDGNSIFKRIVFASVNIRCLAFINNDYPYYNIYNREHDLYFIAISLINNTNHWKNENQYIFGSKFLDNVDFMRKTILDYSDELWEELNNGPISSSEIYTNSTDSANNKYKNKSISGNQYNLPEETIDDYANSIPVLDFKNEESKPNSVISNIVNPKTFTNGIVILGIVVILSIGFSLFIIKRKSKNSI